MQHLPMKSGVSQSVRAVLMQTAMGGPGMDAGDAAHRYVAHIAVEPKSGAACASVTEAAACRRRPRVRGCKRRDVGFGTDIPLGS